MSTWSIAVVVGSLRKESINRQFAEELVQYGPADFSFRFLSVDLPQYNQDDDANPAEPVKRFKEAILSSQGVLFVTPEYNRSIPGVLKNALDHGSRPYGKSVWKGKPAGIVGVSVAPLGTATAQQHLRNILTYLDMPTLSQPEAFIALDKGTFNATGDKIRSDKAQVLGEWMAAFAAWVRLHSPEG